MLLGDRPNLLESHWVALARTNTRPYARGVRPLEGLEKALAKMRNSREFTQQQLAERMGKKKAGSAGRLETGENVTLETLDSYLAALPGATLLELGAALHEVQTGERIAPDTPQEGPSLQAVEAAVTASWAKVLRGALAALEGEDAGARAAELVRQHRESDGRAK